MSTQQDNTGDDNVIIGNGQINGNRNVIINATDANGNIILNRPMIIGYNAQGGPNDIVIWSGAGAGSELFLILNQLASESTPEVAGQITTLISELKSEQKDKSKIATLWSSIENAVTVGGAIDLVMKAGILISAL